MSTLTASPATTSIRIPIKERMWLDAEIFVPPAARGIVLFAHGSGSSRRSPRNRYVAAELNDRLIGTVLADLLTGEEEQIDVYSGALRFDISMLTRRLIQLIDWARASELVEKLPVGLFGASTGAAAALDAAAARSEAVRAVVSRGGRPDLATHLGGVRAPTLLIVGGNDTTVLGMNQSAFRRLECEKKLEIVPRATHLFEETGTLETVASLAGAWFQRYLAPATGSRP
jgi:pimeloyl-ACP methyl ester carboxylesterase